MKREIKFRAFDKKTKIMRYAVDIKNSVLGARACYATPNSFLIYYSKSEDEILMQFTGLKDKNGKEIYEGDIVLDGDNNKLVKWSNQNAAFYMGHTDGKRSFYKEFIECGQWQSDGPVHCDTIETIGNIHENPELLNSGQSVQVSDTTGED